MSTRNYCIVLSAVVPVVCMIHEYDTYSCTRYNQGGKGGRARSSRTRPGTLVRCIHSHHHDTTLQSGTTRECSFAGVDFVCQHYCTVVYCTVLYYWYYYTTVLMYVASLQHERILPRHADAPLFSRLTRCLFVSNMMRG